MIRRRTAIYFKDSQSKAEPARGWLEKLKDRVAQAAIYVRIARAESGNFGDHKSVGEGVMEMRIPFGPGYRLYYAFDGQEVILLLVGGDKSTQSKDIRRAKEFWESHKAKNKRG
jgi:putative addiction module killer protein